MQFEVTVQREAGAKHGFSPASVQAQVGDSVYWFNADKKTQHQPYLVTPGDWAANPIDPRQPSTQVNTDAPGVYHYRCALHPDESGVILVCSAIMIGPTGNGTSTFSFATPPVPAGTSVSFGNADAMQHWPMPQGGSKTAWFKAAIAPGDISAPVAFNTVQNLVCQCAIHTSETIALQVAANNQTVTIGPGPVPPSVLFAPVFIQIVTGQAVTWSNTDSNPHQPAPDSGPDTAWFAQQIPGGSAAKPTSGAYTFNTPGTYPYHDVLNPNMRGLIQVGQG